VKSGQKKDIALKLNEVELKLQEIQALVEQMEKLLKSFEKVIFISFLVTIKVGNVDW
jgi:hypothetical protein